MLAISIPDLNTIKNLWSIIKRRVYPGHKQYSNKTELWDAIKNVCVTLKPAEIKKLTATINDSVFAVVEQNGNYINK